MVTAVSFGDITTTALWSTWKVSLPAPPLMVRLVAEDVADVGVAKVRLLKLLLRLLSIRSPALPVRLSITDGRVGMPTEQLIELSAGAVHVTELKPLASVMVIWSPKTLAPRLAFCWMFEASASSTSLRV